MHRTYTIRLPQSGRKIALGVLVEEHAFLYVEGMATTAGISLLRFGEVGIEHGYENETARTKELLKVFGTLRRKAKTKSLYVAIPDNTATFFELSLPERDPFLLEKLIKKEIARAVGRSNPTFLQTEILFREGNMTKVAVAIVPEDPILEMQHIAAESDFNLKHVGLATEASAELAARNEVASIIVSVHDKETRIAILSKGSLVIEKTIPTGFAHWVKKISETYSIERQPAEESLFFEGIFRDGGEKLAPELKGELRKMTDAIEKLFLYWHVDCRKERECRVQAITLSGEGATIPGLAHYIEGTMKLAVHIPKPFSELPIPRGTVPEMTEAESLRFLPALALAVRGLLSRN